MPSGIEEIIMTLFFGVVIAFALIVAWEWPVRASIIILLLGTVGLILVPAQLVLDFKAFGVKGASVARPTYDLAPIEAEGRWGSLEIWAWLVGLFAAIHVIGFPIALPLFVLMYCRTYGGGWLLSFALSLVTFGFLYGVFEQILHAPWPDPLVGVLRL
jgi:Tripartite tricarboxylate transporter TctB family